MRSRPDLLVLSGVSPANAPQLIRSARELGFAGLISTETAQDAGVLADGAGDLANLFIIGDANSGVYAPPTEMKPFAKSPAPSARTPAS